MNPPRSASAWSLVLLVGAPILGPTAEDAASQERALEPEDMYRLVSVGGVAVSPDARHVAFTVREVDEEENERESSVWMQELEDGEPVGEPFRFTDPTRNASSPRWSPDGSLLSFTSRRGEDDQTVWFLRVGPPGGEAFEIEGVEAPPIWSPDGGTIAFLDEPEEEPGDEEEAAEENHAGNVAPDAITATLDPERFDGDVVTHRRYKRDGRRDWLPHPDERPRDQLWVVPGDGGEPEQLTDLPYSVGGVEWDADGEGFFFTLDPHEDDELHFQPSSDIHYVPVHGGEPRPVLDDAGAQRSPAVSPDGDRLAYLHTSSWFDQTQLKVVELGDDRTPVGEPVNLTEEWIYSPGSPEWSSDGERLRFSTGVRGNTHLFQVAASGSGGVEAVTEGERTLGSFSRSHGDEVMAYVAQDPRHPGEVHLARADGSRETRLTGFNDELLEEVAIQPAERIEWTVSDGTVVDGWVIPPKDHDPDETYPMVMSVHGGPHSAYRTTFSDRFQMLSGSGFYVFYPNPRGSTTYGNEFQHAIHAGWGKVDEEDFVTGVEAVLETYPDVDPDRLGVMGGSYGGYMTNWLTARTDLFSAAVTRASISQWESLAKTTDSNLPHLPFDGASFQQRELYRELSPISYVENVTAPTLVIHGEEDYRTPLGEGEQWYGALQKLGVPTEFVLYPRQAHGIREPWLAADSRERTRSWFEHWLIDMEGATPTVDEMGQEVGEAGSRRPPP